MKSRRSNLLAMKNEPIRKTTMQKYFGLRRTSFQAAWNVLNEVLRINHLFCGLDFFVCPFNHFFNHDFFYCTDKCVHKVKVYGVVLCGESKADYVLTKAEAEKIDNRVSAFQQETGTDKNILGGAWWATVHGVMKSQVWLSN